MEKAYKLIPLERLEAVRLQVRADFKKLESTTGKRYSFRTFYLGPRKVYGSRRQGTTNKADAYAAKIAIYEVKSNSSYSYNDLVTYV
jgi:hypothetical protein